MTTEEIEIFIDNNKQYCNKTLIKFISVPDVAKLVNKIQDDFESRICGNCKYHTSFTSCSKNIERPSKFLSLHEGYEPISGFGCNKFQRIDV